MNNRITVVDSLRGLSLFGILAANMLIFQYGIYGKDELETYSVSKLDHGLHILLKVLVESSFMPIFAFLFGYGMIKMKESLEKKGLPVKRYLARRFLLIFLIGIVHSTYLWEGDILTTYGIIGFILLLFMNRNVKTLYIWGTSLLFITAALSYGMGDFAVTKEEKAIFYEYVTTTIDVYGNGSFSEIQYHRLNEDPLTEMIPDVVILFIVLLVPIITLPMFLFGMIASKQQWFKKLTEPNVQSLWRALGVGLIGSGVLLKLLPYVLKDFGISGVGYALGGPVLAFGYIFFFTLLLNRKETIVVKGFTAIGRLSLTNYLLQTIICIMIFYGFGLGYFGKLGILFGIGLTILIYSLQLVVSLLYLKAFQTGPFEKILRIWTYLKWDARPPSIKAKVNKKQVV